jgi:aspartate beta-hydroxylase
MPGGAVDCSTAKQWDQVARLDFTGLRRFRRRCLGSRFAFRYRESNRNAPNLPLTARFGNVKIRKSLTRHIRSEDQLIVTHYPSDFGADVSQQQIAQLMSEAANAAAAAQWNLAETLWRKVHALEPGNVQALFSLGVRARQRHNPAEALDLLNKAHAAAPQDPMIPLTISVVHRDMGNLDAEWRAITSALSADPYFLPGLLSKGEFLERAHQPKAAASVFRDVLKIAPAESQWPAALRRRLEQARRAVDRDTEELEAYLHRVVTPQRSAVEEKLSGRWDEAISILAGRTRPYASECNRLHIPRLPAIPFYDRELFPWIPQLEAQTPAIQAELESLIHNRTADFKPYVAYKPGEPVNQWQALNHSRAWSSYHLWAHGSPVVENITQCPRTVEALSAIESAEIGGLCPNVMFSVLEPHTRIPPHTGETNARLVAHLPLVVPSPSSFRVGYEWKQWEPGQVLVFDDTIEHEARNDSDELRVVLIFDVWNPLLSAAERQMVSALSGAIRDYRTTLNANH